jgi:hypothetical protein
MTNRSRMVLMVVLQIRHRVIEIIFWWGQGYVRLGFLRSDRLHMPILLNDDVGVIEVRNLS